MRRQLASFVLVLGGLMTIVAGCSAARRCVPGQAAPEARQVFVDINIVRIPESEIVAALGDHTRALATDSTSLSREDAAMLLNRWRMNDAIKIISAPKMLTLEGQEGTLSIGESIRFGETVADAGGALRVVETSQSPLWVGERLHLVSTPTPSGSTIRIQLRYTWREYVREPEENELSGMTKEDYRDTLTISSSLDAEFHMPNDGNVLLGGFSVVEDGDGRYVRAALLHARVVSPAEAANVTLR